MSPLPAWEGRPPRDWADAWSVPLIEAHAVLGSTNDRARELAAAGAPAFTTVIADLQTSGRGRGGAAWLAPAGSSLLISTILPVTSPPALHLPLLVGLAAARAIETVCPGAAVGIEWPNDLVLGGKVAGVLCEAAQARVVAGLGVNVRQGLEDFPDDLRARAGSLAAAGHRGVSRAALAGSWLGELARLLAASGAGLAPTVHGELARRDVLVGRRVRTHRGEAVARGIAPDGALLVDEGAGEPQRVVAGSAAPV